MLSSALCAPSLCAAGELDVKPVRIALAGPSSVGVIELGNHGDDVVWIQTRVQAWRQEAGRQVLTDSDDLIVSPPMLELRPGLEQVIRVGLRSSPERRSETAYRLFLEEVPRAAHGGPGLHVRLRLALPVFVAPEQPSQPAPSGRLALGPGAARLRLHNPANLHLLVKQAELTSAEGGAALARLAAPRYLLPGETAELTLAPVADADLAARGPASLRALLYTDRGRLEIDVEPD